MRSNGSKLFVAVILAGMGSAAVARAEEAAAPSPLLAKPAKALPWFVALGGGVGYAQISHPEIHSGGAPVPVFSLNGGYTFGDHLTVGIEFSSAETKVGRDTPQDLFQIGYSPKPLVIWEIRGCDPCEPKRGGSEVINTSLVFTSLGARVEYAPFSRDGLFVGAMAGMGFMVGLEEQAGFSFGGRVGYRLRASNVLTFSIEAGMTGQIYGDTTVYVPLGVATLRPYFESGVRPYPKKPAKPAPPAR